MIKEERQFETILTAAHALADELAVILRQATEARGKAFLAVSGGRTPQHVFERLRQLDVDWNNVTITLTDERWVSSEHPESNEKLVRTNLLTGPAAAAAFVPLYGGEDSPEAGEEACEHRLACLDLPFDAVYLGMGDDGHFASLFPGESHVHVADRLCVAIPAAHSRLPRMSLTAPTILNARKIFLLFSGADKHMRYTEAKNPGSSEENPIWLILLQEKTDVYVLSAP